MVKEMGRMLALFGYVGQHIRIPWFLLQNCQGSANGTNGQARPFICINCIVSQYTHAYK